MRAARRPADAGPQERGRPCPGPPGAGAAAAGAPPAAARAPAAPGRRAGRGQGGAVTGASRPSATASSHSTAMTLSRAVFCLKAKPTPAATPAPTSQRPRPAWT